MIAKNKKIIYLVNHFHTHGGIEKMLSLKIDAWIEYYGYQVTIVTVNQANKPIVYPPRNQFNLIDLGLQRKKKRYSFSELIDFRNKIKRVLKTENPDIVFTTLTGIPSLLLPLINRRTSNILEIHSSGALSVTSSWKYKWYFLRKYKNVVVLNEDERQYYQLENLAVIPNFVEDSEQAIEYSERKKTVIAAGRIHPDKQYDQLLKIWEIVFEKYPDWNLEIYGDGDIELLNSFKNYISKKKLERIAFKPAIGNLNSVLRNSSLLVLTSATECFPMVLLESKQNMLPVISYDSPNGPRHIISNDGVLVEHNNIEEFAKQLEILMKDETLRKELAENAYENRIMFSSENIIKMWNNLI
ncbi:glycosyltransferase [Weeksellaceae bacterium A-14]